VSKFNEVFSGCLPHQVSVWNQCFEDHLGHRRRHHHHHHHHHGSDVIYHIPDDDDGDDGDDRDGPHNGGSI
jgi:hypothetical protein